ncbi:MAG: NADH-quinone oxidoreductase subunit H [Phycisphaeraceae bacterium]|nr:NADH-quinone oxidoreductase subunit H [Phycisphaeraceae bacterium]
MHQFITSVILIVVIIHVLLLGVAYLILLERKMASWIQDRIGPNRVGPVGLLQPIADGIKFLLKEEFTPPFVDRTLFRLAPLLVIVPALLGWAVIPWGGYFQSDGFSFPSWLPFAGGIATGAFTVNITAVPISIGLIYILAIGSLAVYGVVIGGYASNNKYSFLGGLRATAQMLSYEIPMGLCVLMIILMHGSANASDLVHLQANGVARVYTPKDYAITRIMADIVELIGERAGLAA